MIQSIQKLNILIKIIIIIIKFHKAITIIQITYLEKLQKEETRHNQRILNHFNADAEHQRRRKNIFAK